MNNKYSAVLIVGLLIVAGGIYFLMNQNSNSTASTPTPTSDYNGTPTSTTSKPKPTPAPVPPQVIHNVSIVGFAFVPSSITVRKGETIVWTNKDSTPHTVTGGDLQSLSLAQNQTYSFAYDKTGSFSYHCSLHPSMKGTVIVTN